MKPDDHLVKSDLSYMYLFLFFRDSDSNTSHGVKKSNILCEQF